MKLHCNGRCYLSRFAVFLLLFNPELLTAQLQPLMEYTETGRWRFPFASHDLGTYPQSEWAGIRRW